MVVKTQLQIDGLWFAASINCGLTQKQTNENNKYLPVTHCIPQIGLIFYSVDIKIQIPEI
jgi:hypothetical protein